MGGEAREAVREWGVRGEGGLRWWGWEGVRGGALVWRWARMCGGMRQRQPACRTTTEQVHVGRAGTNGKGWQWVSPSHARYSFFRSPGVQVHGVGAGTPDRGWLWAPPLWHARYSNVQVSRCAGAWGGAWHAWQSVAVTPGIQISMCQGAWGMGWHTWQRCGGWQWVPPSHARDSGLQVLRCLGRN